MLDISRDDFIELMNERGIGLAVHYKPIHLLSYYKKHYKFNKNNFPTANLLFNSIITLPLYPSLTDNELDYVIENILKLYKIYSKSIPILGKLILGKSEPYTYLVDSIEKFYSQKELSEKIKEQNFINISFKNLSGGIVAIHSAWKI